MLFYCLFFLPWLTGAVPALNTPRQAGPPSSYWLSQIQRQGTVPYGSDPGYKIFRNVKDYGAVGQYLVALHAQTLTLS